MCLLLLVVVPLQDAGMGEPSIRTCSKQGVSLSLPLQPGHQRWGRKGMSHKDIIIIICWAPSIYPWHTATITHVPITSGGN
jgi:hypothetical protein